MELDFDRLPRFKLKAIDIMALIHEWSTANNVSRDAVVDQIYTAHAWCNSNPRKAPKKDPVRFLWSWMRQAKRYGNLKTPEKPQPKKPAEQPNYEMTIEEMREIRLRNMRRVR